MTWFEEFCNFMKAVYPYEIDRLSDIVVDLIFEDDFINEDVLFSDAVNEYVREWQLQLF